MSVSQKHLDCKSKTGGLEENCYHFSDKNGSDRLCYLAARLHKLVQPFKFES